MPLESFLVASDPARLMCLRLVGLSSPWHGRIRQSLSRHGAKTCDWITTDGQCVTAALATSCHSLRDHRHTVEALDALSPKSTGNAG